MVTPFLFFAQAIHEVLSSRKMNMKENVYWLFVLEALLFPQCEALHLLMPFSLT